MTNTKRLLAIPAALVAMILMSSSAAAQCDTCNSTTGFGFPSGSNGNCTTCTGPLHSAFHHIHEGVETYCADARLNHARGEAWPLPFSCWDREHYYSIFNQQYAHGLQVAHTLTSEYFDPETNELNRAGEMRVAWIMQNAPQANKQIFVYEDKTGPTMDQRISMIRNFTDRYYQHLGQATIVKSQLLPHQVPATYQANTLQQYAGAQADPVIPIQAGATINSTVGN